MHDAQTSTRIRIASLPTFFSPGHCHNTSGWVFRKFWLFLAHGVPGWIIRVLCRTNLILLQQGLAPELMKKSSGEVTAPELVFSHWEVLDEDPFWIPTTEEEREDYGQNLQTGDSSTGLDNNALKYIRMVRNRKGLLVDSSKIVVAAEKQRTLSRKK